MAPPKLPGAARRPPARAPRRHLPALLVGGALAAAGCGTLAYAAAAMRRGWMDARSRFAPAADFLYAAEEPFWFYGLAAALALLGATALVVAVRMLRHGWGGGTGRR